MAKIGEQVKALACNRYASLVLLIVFVISWLGIPYASLRVKEVAVQYAKHRNVTDLFRREIERTGTRFHRVTLGNGARNSSTVVLAATGPRYKWATAWVDVKRRQDLPFVHLELTNVRGGELNHNWARLPALMAVKKLLPRAERIVYTDTDTFLNWKAIDGMKSDRLMTISSKVVQNKQLVLRTNWFILRTKHNLCDRLLNTWYYTGRDVPWQDQTVLNELYARKSWVRDSITLVKSFSENWVELRHCGSWLKEREACVMEMNRRGANASLSS